MAVLDRPAYYRENAVHHAARGARRRPPVRTLAVLFALLTVGVVTAAGPMLHVDKALGFAPWAAASSSLSSVATTVALIGQRGYSAPFLLVVAVVLAWRRRMLRPVTLALAGLLALNVVVGGIKLVVARPSPLDGDWLPFAGGTDFPSGHTSNTVLTWGLLAWLVLTFARAGSTRWRRRAAVGFVVLASLAVGAASLYLRTHWISDIVGGWIIGFLLLLLVTGLHTSPRWSARLNRLECWVLRADRRSRRHTSSAEELLREGAPRAQRFGLVRRLT